MKNVWDFDLLSNMPEMSTEQAKKEWAKLKDSKEKSDQNKLKLLMAQIAFQEILYVAKKYGYDEEFIFSKFNMKWVMEFFSGRDLNRGFFWADLYEVIQDRCRSFYVRIHKEWIKTEVFERVRNRILMEENRTKEEIIDDVLLKEGNGLNFEVINTIYDDIQREKERKIEEEKLKEAFMSCDFAKKHPETIEPFYYTFTELTEREKNIITEYLGLTDGKPKGIDEICSMLDLPNERVDRVLRKFYRNTMPCQNHRGQFRAFFEDEETETES